jgi:hypothetical protein
MIYGLAIQIDERGSLFRAFGILSPDDALAGFSTSGLLTAAVILLVAVGVHSSGGVGLLVN